MCLQKMIRFATCNLVYLMPKDILFLVVGKFQTFVFAQFFEKWLDLTQWLS